MYTHYVVAFASIMLTFLTFGCKMTQSGVDSKIQSASTISSMVNSCLFGETFRSLGRQHGLSVKTLKTAKPGVSLSNITSQQIIQGMHHLGRTLASVDDAYNLTDDKEIGRRYIKHSATDQSYYLYYFYAGDNMAGFVMKSNSFEVIAEISDEDFVNCAIPSGGDIVNPTPGQCRFVDKFGNFLDMRDQAISKFRKARPHRTLTATSNADERIKKQVIDGMINHIGDAPGYEVINSYVDAINATDDAEIALETYDDELSGKRYNFYYFHSGDNPIGYIFEDGANGGKPVAVLGDGDVGDCSVNWPSSSSISSHVTASSRSCIFGDSIDFIEQNTDVFKRGVTKRYKDSSTFSAIVSNQIIAFGKREYDPATRTAKSVIQRWDGKEFYRSSLTHLPTGKRYTYYEYGAGDNTHAFIALQDASDIVAQYGDGDLKFCTER